LILVHRIEPENSQVKFALRQARVLAFKQGQAAAACITKSPPPTAAAVKDKGNASFGGKSFAEAAGYYSLALELLKEGTRDDSTSVTVLRSNRSGAYLGLGFPLLALEDAKRCVVLDPSWVKGYSRLGAAQAATGDWEAAVATYEEGLELEPGHVGLQQGLAEAAKLST